MFVFCCLQINTATSWQTPLMSVCANAVKQRLNDLLRLWAQLSSVHRPPDLPAARTRRPHADPPARCDHAGGTLLIRYTGGGGQRGAAAALAWSAGRVGTEDNTDPQCRRGHVAPEGERESGSHFYGSEVVDRPRRTSQTGVKLCVWMLELHSRRRG